MRLRWRKGATKAIDVGGAIVKPGEDIPGDHSQVPPGWESEIEEDAPAPAKPKTKAEPESH